MQSPFFHTFKKNIPLQRQKQQKKYNTQIKFEPFINKNPQMQNQPMPLDISKLKEIMQNECNGKKFYQSITDICPDQHKNSLEIIKNHSQNRINILNEIYTTQIKNSFIPSNININQIKNFHSAIRFAIEEENNTIQNLFELYQNTQNDVPKINYLLQNKIYDLNLLTWMLQKNN